MATITGTYVQTGLSSTARINALVDIMLAPHLVEFRQIIIYHEPGTHMTGNNWRFTYQHWNPDFIPEVFLNQSTTPLCSVPTLADYTTDNTTTLAYVATNKASSFAYADSDMGLITIQQPVFVGATPTLVAIPDTDPVLYQNTWIDATYTAGDNVICTYCFDYFPIYVMEGFFNRSVQVVNSSGAGVPTQYTIDNAPTNWDSIFCDIVLSMCMEKLIIEYDLWKGRLIFAISPEELMSGGGNSMDALTTIKSNAEERANNAMNNPKLKSPPTLSPPTAYYYSAITMGGSGPHGMVGAGGRLRGWRGNAYGTNVP